MALYQPIEKYIAAIRLTRGFKTLLPFGYTLGAGGTVTQATSRTTGVTLNKLTGQITTNTASLAAEAAAEFTVTNSQVAAGDVVIVSATGANSGMTAVYVSGIAAGSFKITVANNNAAAGTAETAAIVINFVVIKGSVS